MNDRNNALHLLTVHGGVTITVNETDTGIQEALCSFFDQELTWIRIY
jgi:hypothetical protein